ncbi:MAG: DNA-3-methyladenine glycosylase 2 family protein [Clostridia bacterium]|nr:DNA-3-methyladenine glycosylase 2 family protein [Clostridia bacterium]MBQ7122944.1 DNA-3-methyladenine glycosylase 2 family protein [Clostridia bacterium]
MISEKQHEIHTGNIAINTPCFNLGLTLDCGQAFRWSQDSDGDWHGVAFSKPLTLRQTGNGIELIGTSAEDFENIWKPYFDLDRDYDTLCKRFSNDKQLKKAVTECYGIRLLKQEPWEALCSFIISQNNNIPRIKGIIDRLCRLLGEYLGRDDYAFPTPQKIAEAGVDGLAPIRAGFRAKYIIDAAQKVANGEIDFENILLPSTSIDEGRDELIKIKGVGEKVAQCTLLYGCGKVDALPIDVWVKRILAEDYPDGFPECTNGVRGIAQQYLFHWKRTQ